MPDHWQTRRLFSQEVLPEEIPEHVCAKSCKIGPRVDSVTDFKDCNETILEEGLIKKQNCFLAALQGNNLLEMVVNFEDG